MAIALGINNIITFVTVLSPIIIGAFFILSSVFNVDFSGFTWFIGVVLLQIIAHFIRRFLGNRKKNIWLNTVKYKNKEESERLKNIPHDYCSIFEPLFESDKSTFLIDNHLLFHSFTLTYLIMNFSLPEYSDPEFNNPVNNKTLYNFIYGYIVLIVLDIGYRFGNGCIKINKIQDDIISIGAGIGFGALIGFAWWNLIKALTDPYYHKYLLLGSNTIVKCDISKGVFQCKNDNQIYNSLEKENNDENEESEKK